MSRIQINNGDFERLPRGDIPSKLPSLKGWESVSDYPEDAGYSIHNYFHYNYLPQNTWDMAGRRPLAQNDTDADDQSQSDFGLFALRPPAEHFLDMGGTGQNSSLFQRVENLKDEQPLTLSFDYFDLAKYHGFEENDDSYYGASTLKVYWNYKLVAEISGDNSEGWSHIDINVMAGPNGEGDLKIYEKGTEGDNAGIAIDNVTVRPRMDRNGPEKRSAESETVETDSQDDTLAADGPRPGNENLVVNGSFERFKGKVEDGGYGQFDRIPGWAPAEKGDRDQFEIHHETIDHSAPNSETTHGSYYLDTGLTPGNMAIRQQIEGVKAGDVLEISIDYFDHAMADGASVDSGRMEVWWNDTLLGRIDGGNADNWNTWQYRLLVPGKQEGALLEQLDAPQDDTAVLADDASTSGLAGKPPANVLTLREVGTEDNLGLGIDNVQVVVLHREEEKQEEEVENEMPGVVTVPEGEAFLTEEENTLNTEIETDLFTT